VGDLHGPPVTVGRRRRTADAGGVELIEVRTTSPAELPPDVRTTADRGDAALEEDDDVPAAAAVLGAVLLAAEVTVDDFRAVLFFFFLVVVVGVPSRSAPDSISAVKKSGKRRIISNAMTCSPVAMGCRP